MTTIICNYLLWALQVSVYNLVLVEVVHPSGNLFGPLHQLLGGHLLPLPEGPEECPVGAVLHHNTEHGGLDTNSPGNIKFQISQYGRVSKLCKNSLELNNVGMVELPQVFDVSLELLLHFLHGEDLGLVGPHEDGALGTRAEPFQVSDLLEGNLPAVI